MKRRDVLKMAPAPILGAAGAAGLFGHGGRVFFPGLGDPARFGLAAKAGAAGVAVAEIRPHHGSPALFLDGRPVFPAIAWTGAPRPDGWDFAAQARLNAETGIHIYAFDVGSGVEWTGPGPGRSGDHDFSTVEARFGRVLEADPQALFHLRIQLEIGHGDWWQKAHPDELEILDDGRRNGQSFASRVWRAEAKAFLEAYISHLRAVGLYDRVIAYQVGAGHTGEWVKGESSMYRPCGDYSRPMREYFGSWLRARYGGDAARLRVAWNDPAVTFESAAVPAAERQLEAGAGTFRDPARDRDVIDYFLALADLCGGAVADFCRAVKEATRRQKLAGAFYGYVMELAWNGGFFKERPDSDYSTTQRSGHLGLGRVLDSPDVDFLVSPYSYGFRGLGGDAPSMLPAESVRRSGKLLLIEDDTRTHVDARDPDYGRVKTLEDSRTILRRNLAHFLSRGEGCWWALWKVDAVREPAFGPLLREFRELGERSMALDRAPAAEIAVLVDDESYFYETSRHYLDLPLIFQQRLWGLPRMGAPFDTYLLRDLVAGRLPPYKLYVFLNPLRLDDARRAALDREIRRDGRVALWIYAPGYIRERAGLENMESLTGFRFGAGEQPWGPLVHITDFEHPITEGLSPELVWGTNFKLAPIFHVDDPEARVLGEVVYSQGNCRPGFAVKAFPEWASVYSAAPNLPAPVLRGIARYAGVHLYSEAGDVLYANRNLLGVHTVNGGPRVFRLPRRAAEVVDLFEKRVVARDADRFEVRLAPRSSSLYLLDVP
jgi:hypothetical protein